MHIKDLAAVGAITLILTQTAFADGVAQAVDGLESDVGTLESDIGTLQSDVGTLQFDVDALETQLSALQAENSALQGVITSLTSIVDGLVDQQNVLIEQQRCHTRPGDLQADENGDYAGGVDWRGCDKTGLALWGPLWGGDQTQVLTNADLRSVNFTLANIWGVPMGGANLEGAIFKNANLAGSNLCGANIVTWQQAQDYAHLGIQETVFINTSCPDGTNSNAAGGTCANNRAPVPCE